MAEGSYCNFDLILERSGGDYRVRVLDSPAGQASAILNVPLSPLELENFVLRIGRPRTGVRRVDTLEMEAVKKCGDRLFRAVFTDDVYACFLRSRDSALQQGGGLRIRLRIDIPEFHDFPWELLYNASLNQFLALSRDTPVVRYLELPYPLQPLAVKPPLKILVMISSPLGFPPLNVEEEWRRLNTALAPLTSRGLVELDLLSHPTLSALQQHLRRGEYHIFHFIGHGKYSEHKQDGLLLLEDDGGQGRPVSGQYLSTVLQDHHSLRLVVLNACEGARTSQEDPYTGVAQTLVLQGIPAVIAMQFEIAETAAITFAQEFYGAVADGFAVDAALSEARKAIFAAGNEVEWATPVLYMRAPQGVIFDLPKVASARSPQRRQPAAYVDRDLEQKLEQLYTEGLAAFWVEDWEKACDRFQRILNDSPGHTAASEKLAEAGRRRDLSALYSRAVEAQDAEDWTGALGALEELLKASSDYRDARARLETVKRQKQLAELYTEARQLYAAMKWQAVTRVLAQIKSIDPQYADNENLLSRAEAELEKLRRQAELDDLYSRGLRAMDASRWEEAQSLFKQLEKAEPGFQETQRLLSKVEEELRRDREEQERRDHISTLYENAHALLRSKKWAHALEKMSEIRRLDERFKDADLIEHQAQEGRAREQEGAKRQAEATFLYEEAVGLLRAEKYTEALEKWQQVRSIDPSHSDARLVELTARKSLAAREESLRREQEAKRRNELAGMYAEALRLVRAQRYDEALQKWEQIRNLDPGYPDPKLIERTIKKNLHAQDRSTDKEQGAKRLDELAGMYAEAVQLVREEQYQEALDKWQAVRMLAPAYPDQQQVEWTARRQLGALETPPTLRIRPALPRKLLWIGLAGIAALGLIIMALNLGATGGSDLYDDFERFSFQGGFNPALWHYGERDPGGEVRQDNGVLVLTQGGVDRWTTLVANRYEEYTLDESGYIEARLKIDPDADGYVRIIARTDFPGRFPMCGLHTSPGQLLAQCWTPTDGVPSFPVEQGSWHTARIELDVRTNKIRYFMDERLLVEEQFERSLRGTHVWLSVGVHAGPGRPGGGGPVTGFVDKVRIGPLP